MGKNAKKKQERRAQRTQYLQSETPAAIESHDGAEELGKIAPLVVTVLHVALLCALVFVRGAFPMEAEDVFSNIVTGEYIWTHQTIPTSDPFSFTGPYSWSLNRPLSCVLLYAVHTLGGLPAVQIVCIALYAVAYTLLYLTWSRRTGRPLLSFVVVAVAIMASCYWFHPRTYAFGYPLFVCCLLALTSERVGRALWVVPLIALWVNCHPSFILGLLLIVVWGVSGCVSRRLSQRFALGVVVASLAASTLSPQGLGCFSKIFEELFTSHPSRANILEWLSPFSPLVYRQYFSWWFFAIGALSVPTFVTAASLRVRPHAVGVLLPFSVILFLLSLGCARHIPLFYLAFSGLLLVVIDASINRGLERGSTLRARAVSVGVIAITCLTIIKTTVAGYAVGDTSRTFGLGIDRRKFPTNIFLLLKNARVEGNIFTSYDIGSYFLYTMYPDYKVYIDGARLDEVYGEGAYSRYMEIGNSIEAMRQEIDRYDIRSAVVPLPASESEIVQLYKLLSNDPQWGLAYFDDVHMLFVKRVEAAQRGIATYKLLSPFASLQDLMLQHPERQAVLARDFEQGERLGFESLAFLGMKARFQRLVGEDFTGTLQKMQTFCSRRSPVMECRVAARQHLINLGAFWESKQVQ